MKRILFSVIALAGLAMASIAVAAPLDPYAVPIVAADDLAFDLTAPPPEIAVLQDVKIIEPAPPLEVGHAHDASCDHDTAMHLAHSGTGSGTGSIMLAPNYPLRI